MIEVDAKTTTYVVLACIIAASGGVLFGYDGGVTGTRVEKILHLQQPLSAVSGPLAEARSLLQVVWSPWNSLAVGFSRSRKVSPAVSTANTMTKLCRHTPLSCISPEPWPVFRLRTSRSTGAAKGMPLCVTASEI